MPHHGNEEEHGSSESRREAEQRENEPQKPVIHDNRKVDPKTGQARHPDQERAAAAADSGSGDALSQAEDILNSVEVPAAESVAQGAKVVTGGERNSEGELFYTPTILSNVTQEMPVFTQEIFGPVAPVIRFETEEEAIEIANNTPFGLAAYFYAETMSRIWRVSEGLEYGMVAINDGILSTEVAPFGGVKESGTGREGSKYGLEDYLEIKYMLMGGIR